MFRILDGREQFYQWDLNCKLVVDDATIREVHFCNRTGNCSLIRKTYAVDGMYLVDVPDILLQTDWRINVYGYDGSHTKHSEYFKVISRTKPEDYVFTDTEVKYWESLEARITELEENGVDVEVSEEDIEKAVEAYMAENPVEVPEVDLTGYVKSVNGNAPDENGNVDVSSGAVSNEQIAQAVADYMAEHPVSGGSSVYIGAVQPTDGTLYWLDTSEDEPTIPENPDEPDVPEKTLNSISATYSGGDVSVGTVVTALTGIVVTANYSDGSTETVTGYTLSGTIAEGSNTITVSYGGKTTTITVVGVAESGGDEPGNEWEAVDVTNVGSSSLVWYSDDGATVLANTTKARSYTGVFEADTEVKIELVLSVTQYGTFYVGMMNDNGNFCYAEKFGDYYPYNSGTTYERTFTVKAGYALVVGGWSALTNIETLNVWKKV